MEKDNPKKYAQNFNNFINDSLLAIYFLDLDTKKIIYANTAFFHLLGYLPEELDSLIIYKIENHPKEEIDAIFEGVMQTKQCKIGEREWRKKDGTVINIFVKASYACIDNRRVLHVSGNDITELKKAEIEKGKLINELSDKYNKLMQFNYIISHNLRSPIATILGLVDLMYMPSINEEDRAKIIGYIKSATLSMDTMVKDLSKLLAASVPLNNNREAVCIHSLIQSISDSLKNQIFESNCIIETDIDEDAKEVFTIKSYMESILYNLMNNAIKFKLPMKAPQMFISSRKMNNNLLIKVSDNGMGINLENHGENIFGLYKRFHFETEGKGLGLHMTKTQVEALGGKIGVESTAGKGSTFTITLPIQ